jgi:hypothetical protein
MDIDDWCCYNFIVYGYIHNRLIKVNLFCLHCNYGKLVYYWWILLIRFLGKYRETDRFAICNIDCSGTNTQVLYINSMGKTNWRNLSYSSKIIFFKQKVLWKACFIQMQHGSRKASARGRVSVAHALSLSCNFFNYFIFFFLECNFFSKNIIFNFSLL